MAGEFDAASDFPAEGLAWRSLVLFGAGASAAALGWLVSGSFFDGRLRPAGPVAVWAADRGANCVYGLDADWIVARAIRVGSPLRVASAGERGVWIVRASEARAGSDHHLVLASEGDEADLELELHRCLDLSATRDGEALCITSGDDRDPCAWRIFHDGGRDILVEAEELTAIAGLSASIAIGTSRGELLRIRDDGSAHTCSVIARSIVDLAAGPHADWVWVLDSARDVLLVDARDRIVWRRATGFDAGALAPIPGAELAWVTAREEPRALRVGRVDGLDCADFGTIAAECALGLPHGGVLLALPGAVVHRDGRGRPSPGQGGFHTLVDLAPR